MSNNNLVCVFCSIRPDQLSEEICDFRELEYYICLSQLIRLVPDNFKIVICDNTLNSVDSLKNKELKDIFVSGFSVLLSENIGTSNKGMGEIHMLKACDNVVNFELYDKVSYCTGRKLFTCPYVFERTNSLSSQALISNPDFLFLNGRYNATEKNGMRFRRIM